MSSGRPFHSMDLLGVRVDRIHLAELLGFLRDAGNSDRPVSVLYLNPHIWNLARDDSDLLAVLDGADVIWCDGVGILLAAVVVARQSVSRAREPCSWSG